MGVCVSWREARAVEGAEEVSSFPRIRACTFVNLPLFLPVCWAVTELFSSLCRRVHFLIFLCFSLCVSEISGRSHEIDSIGEFFFIFPALDVSVEFLRPVSSRPILSMAGPRLSLPLPSFSGPVLSSSSSSFWLDLGCIYTPS